MICVNSVNVYPAKISIKTGEWYYGATAQICPVNATYKNVKWSSSNPSVVSVNATNGYIYGNRTGSAIIYATAQDGSGKRGCCSVTVSQHIPVESINLNRSALTLQKADCFKLMATVCPTNASNKTLIWQSSNSNVATVKNGTIQAIRAGCA